MVSIHRPLGYGPSTLPLRHSADVISDHLWCGFVSFVLYCVCSKLLGSDSDSKLGDKKKKDQNVQLLMNFPVSKQDQRLQCMLELILKPLTVELRQHFNIYSICKHDNNNIITAMALLQFLLCT